ncbi:hypothetical protein C4J81_15785 [Deltaproteobacteria bacterium Smac51]|nr:hypothetical protein C4J81_15785 [Deltaproteobacteria bacterium Smac51]
MTSIPLTGTFREQLPWEYIQRTIEMAGLGFWQIVEDNDVSGGYAFLVSDNFLNMSGLDKNSFPRSFDEFLDKCVHPDDHESVSLLTRDSISGKKTKYDIQHRLLNHVTGHWRWVHAYGEMGQLAQDGRATRFFGCIIDIQDSKEAREKQAAGERKLLEEQKRLDAIIEAADALAWDWDLTSDNILYGRALADLGAETRGSREHWFTAPWNHDIVQEDWDKVYQARLKHALGESSYYEATFKARRNDGSTFWAQDRGRVVEWDEEGRPTRMMGVTLDVSWQKKASEELMSSRARLEQVVEAASIATWDWDVVGDKVQVNDFYAKMLGRDKAELENSMYKWIDLVHPDDRERVADNIRRLVENEEDANSAEQRLMHKDGHYIWAYTVARVLERDDEGRSTHMVGIQMNFTERKLMEDIQAHSFNLISSQKETLERQVSERNQLMLEVQREVEALMNDPGNRQDAVQENVRKAMAELAGSTNVDDSFSQYMGQAFKFITNERVWYKAVLDSLPFPTSVFDLSRRWTYLNSSAAKAMGGEEPAEFIGRHYRDGWKNYRDSKPTFMDGKSGKKSFVRHLPETGHFYACQSSVLVDENGQAIGFIETMQDVTDAHQADARMRVMLDATPLASTFFDHDGALIDCNQEAANICGITRKEDYLKYFYDLMPPNQPDGRLSAIALVSGVREAFEKGHSYLEFVLRDIEGTNIPGEVHLSRVEWQDKFVVLGYFRDLRSLRAAQTRLNRERRLLRNILDSSPVSFAIIRDGQIQFSTAHTKSLLGLDIGDPISKCIVNVRELARLRKEVREKKVVNWRPLTVRMPGGEVSENLVNAYDDEFEGRPATLCWLMDVTALRQNERELQVARDLAEESTRAKSAFLANISHEIRTPMNAVIGLNHLMLQTKIDDQQREYLLKSDGAAKSLLRLINDVLDFSKIEAGKLEIVPHEFHLQDLLKNAVDVISTQVGDKGLEFLLVVDPNAPVGLVGDDMRLLQVINNLTSNAVKFTNSGEVSLTVEVVSETETETELRFLVRDTGIGLSRDQSGKLFTAFTQADNSHTRQYGGTGLGLAISKRLVEMMGGAIWCESTLGVGSTFGFTARFGRHSQTQRYIERRTDFSGMTAMAVDDNVLALDILKSFLKAMGFSVLSASSGESALAIISSMNAENRKLDLMLIDWKMPGLDGIETTRRINEITAPDRVPAVIMATAHSCDEVIKEASEVGIKSVLPKPLSPSALNNVLSLVFSRKDLSEDSKKTKLALAAKGRDPVNLVRHLAGARLLLVEDNEVNQLVARRILKKAGFEVKVANHGQEALDMLEDEPYDLVLMDIQMPVMDGLTAARAIRKNPKYEKLPIVAMTAHAMASDREKSLSVGMNDHICKPLDLNELFRSLARWVRNADPAADEGEIGDQND